MREGLPALAHIRLQPPRLVLLFLPIVRRRLLLLAAPASAPPPTPQSHPPHFRRRRPRCSAEAAEAESYARQPAASLPCARKAAAYLPVGGLALDWSPIDNPIPSQPRFSHSPMLSQPRFSHSPMLSQPRFAYLPVGGLAHRFAATRAAAVEHHTAPPAWRWPTGVAVATGAAVATNSRNTNKQQALL